MKTLKYILYGILILIGIALLVGFFGPKEFSLTESELIDASPSTLMALTSNFEESQKWSPWAKRDPNIVNEYSGTPSTIGYSNSWRGNDKVGVGTQTITAMTTDGFKTKLDFEGQGSAESEFKFTPSNDKTMASWSFYSEAAFPDNLFMIIFKGAIVKDYQEGLANLKTLAEKVEAEGARATEAEDSSSIDSE